MKSVDKEVVSKRFDLITILAFISLTFGAFIRLFDFNRWSLFNDELSTIYRAKYDSLSKVIQEGIRSDVHPAINELFIYFWMKLFGDSPLMVRLPYVLMSIVGLYFAYLFIKKLSNKATALLSLMVLSTSQLFVIYSELARPYAIGFCILMIFSYCWINLLRNARLKWVILSALFAALGAMTHYFLALSILLIFFIGLITKEARMHWKHYLSSAVLSLLFFLPHLELSLHQISRKGLGWLPTPQENFLWEFLIYSMNGSTLLLAMIIVAPFIAYFSERKKPQLLSILLAMVFIISFLVGYYYSTLINPVLQFSALIFSLPFLLIFLFSFFQKSGKTFQIYAVLLLLFSSTTLLTTADVLGPKAFGNFQGVAEKLVEWNEEHSGDIMILSNSSSPDYFDYFYKNLGIELEEEMDEVYGYESIREARELIENSKAKFLALGFSNTPIPLEVYEIARLNYPMIVEQDRHFNSEALLFTKGIANREQNFNSSAEQNLDQKWSIGNALDSNFHSPPTSFIVQEENEYSLTFRSKVSEVFEKWPAWINVSAQLRSEDTSKVKLVISLERDGQSIDWRSFDTKLFYTKDDWYQILVVYALPMNYREDDDLLIYFWNPEHSTTLIDDMEIVNYKDTNFDYYQLR